MLCNRVVRKRREMIFTVQSVLAVAALLSSSSSSSSSLAASASASSSSCHSGTCPSTGSSTGLKEYPAFSLLKNPSINKGTSFSLDERRRLGLSGLVPAGPPLPLDLKVNLVMEQVRSKSTPLEKYIYLQTLQDSDETLYFAALSTNMAELMPLVYTPVVGEACQKWSHIYRQQPRGLYISLNDRGNIRDILRAYPQQDIRAIVMTDGERILGLGDLGANGMGIPVGKLALYTACAGIHPKQTLPVTIDVGTNTRSILDDPYYIGTRTARPPAGDKAYDALITEFFDAAQEIYGPQVLIQFEDFGNSNAFRLLEKFRGRGCTFNDDIQGTASVVLGGLIASSNATQVPLDQHRYLFHGAGEAGVGIANLLAEKISRDTGMSLTQARERIWLVDSKGLISSTRTNLEHHKQDYAHVVPGATAGSAMDLLSAIKTVKPTALIGVSAQGGAFTETIVKEMAAMNNRPVVFCLSNPTSKSECTAEQAYKWTDGRAVFASGSPFNTVVLEDGRTFIPGQGNNAYIFPGLGLGAIVAGGTQITDDDFITAAEVLASHVTPDHLSAGLIYPPLSTIRTVSRDIAAAVAAGMISTHRSTSPVAAAIAAAAGVVVDASGQHTLSRESLEALRRHSADVMYKPSYEFDL